MAQEKADEEKAVWQITFGDFGYIEGNTELEFADELFIGVLMLECVQERFKREMFQPKLSVSVE